MKMRSCVHGLAVMLTLGSPGVRAFAIDEDKPYGRASVSVVDGKTRTETVLKETTRFTSEQKVVIHLDANSACEVLFAAFSKTGALANGWRPGLLALGEWDARTLPPDEGPWPGSEPSEPFDIFVVFLPKRLAAAEKARALIAKLSEAKVEPAVAKLQARQLREELSKWATATAALGSLPESAPAKIGGTMRAGAEFPWREFAKKGNFSSTQPAVLVFRHAGE